MKRLLRFSIIWILLGICVSVHAQVVLDFDETYAQELLKPGTPAPDFQLNTPNGKTVKFSEFAKGKYVVIDFWASWCPDCRKDLPEIIRFYNMFHDDGVEFIGVSARSPVCKEHPTWRCNPSTFSCLYRKKRR